MEDKRVNEIEKEKIGIRKNLKGLVIIIVAIIIFTVVFYFYTHSLNNHDDFAKCLSLKGAEMYGTEECHYCKAQKQLFGNSFKYINFIDCDKYREICLKAGIEGYPTWIINNTKYEGKQSLEYLSYLTGCKLE